MLESHDKFEETVLVQVYWGTPQEKDEVLEIIGVIGILKACDHDGDIEVELEFIKALYEFHEDVGIETLKRVGIVI